jgi:type II secretory ATPase GspE/PulE/Tfp pilus assembly ATPase PilB-like protein
VFGKNKNVAATNPMEMGPSVEFKAMGASDQENQATAIHARQSPGIAPTRMVIAQAIGQNAGRLLMDYTAQGVALRLDVDGFWHNQSPMDRQNGDAMLEVMKKLANLDPSERRDRQMGEFKATFQRVTRLCQITSQGVETGERVIIRLVDPKQKEMSLIDLGMRELMMNDFCERIGRPTGEQMPPPPKGIYILSAPPNGGGISTLWVAAMTATDRYTRDFLGVEEKTRREPEIENVDVTVFNESNGETAVEVIPKILMRQPDVFVVPHISNTETLDLLCEITETEGKVIITSTRAKSAAEALLKLLGAASNKVTFIKHVNLVVNTRLVRRLCEGCKMPFQATVQVLHQLQLPPDRAALYQEYHPPPVDPNVPKNKQDLPPPICPRCGGMGYMGRIGMFEMLIVDDNIRQALGQQPSADIVQQLAVKAGMVTLREEGIALLAQGITSIPELQRALQ